MTASSFGSFLRGLAAAGLAGAAMKQPLTGAWLVERLPNYITEIGRHASLTQVASSAKTGLVASTHSQRRTAPTYMTAKVMKFHSYPDKWAAAFSASGSWANRSAAMP